MFLLKTSMFTAILFGVACPMMAQFIDRENGNTYQLHPQKITQPAFRYSLLPTILEKRPGNAAVHYGKVTAEQQVFFNDISRMNAIANLPELSLDQIKESEVASTACPETIYRILREAALCDTCDWELPIGLGPFDELIFVEVQQTRIFARLLVGKARYEIATGDFDSAVETSKPVTNLLEMSATAPPWFTCLSPMQSKRSWTGNWSVSFNNPTRQIFIGRCQLSQAHSFRCEMPSRPNLAYWN